MAYQGMTKEGSKVDVVLELVGQDIMGLKLNPPLSYNKIIYTLPMLTIKEDKGDRSFLNALSFNDEITLQKKSNMCVLAITFLKKSTRYPVMAFESQLLLESKINVF